MLVPHRPLNVKIILERCLMPTEESWLPDLKSRTGFRARAADFSLVTNTSSQGSLIKVSFYDFKILNKKLHLKVIDNCVLSIFGKEAHADRVGDSAKDVLHQTSTLQFVFMDFEPGRCLGLQRKTVGVGCENGTMGQVRQTNKPYSFGWFVVFLNEGFLNYILDVA